MSRFPDIVYAFQFPKDTSGPTIESAHRHADNSVATTILVGATFQNLAADKALVLTNVTATCIPGAAQACTFIDVRATTPALNVFRVAQESKAGVANQQEDLNWQGELIVLGGGTGVVQVQVQALFDAGAVANRIISSISGYVIPRANIANG